MAVKGDDAPAQVSPGYVAASRSYGEAVEHRPTARDLQARFNEVTVRQTVTITLDGSTRRFVHGGRRFRRQGDSTVMPPLIALSKY